MDRGQQLDLGHARTTTISDTITIRRLHVRGTCLISPFFGIKLTFTVGVKFE